MRNILATLFAVSSICYGVNGIYWEPCEHHARQSASKSPNAHSGHGGATMLALNGAEDKNVTLSYLLPDLSVSTAEMKYGMITPKINMGGYYALTAVSKDVNGSDFAIRYLSANGKPTKVSPVKLTEKQKNILEIVPNPLPREHDRYTASKDYQFTVFYDGKPLGNSDVLLNVGENTTVIKAASNGKVGIPLPNNFSGVTPDDRKSKEFVLLVSKTDGNMTHTASFSAPYYPNPNDWWQSQSLGFGGVVLGFLGGLALYMRKTRKDR